MVYEFVNFKLSDLYQINPNLGPLILLYLDISMDEYPIVSCKKMF
ncbi:hypothetical protein ADICYQ_3229 [Cyclobacterium qasimii M12-11B]|uniref:Uncharacterized protein n=1 Tax=Cyclobacterium qasimii M12-11B TaxID=641524 RepID=S7WUQ1_9BACT|nr:hypothetical protein ADICYQ_3229 [Cyclobacterium qasimii M12-11B]